MPDDAPVQPMLQPAGSPPDAIDHAPPGTRWRDWRRLIPAWSGAALALIILVAITAYKQDTFLKLSNVLNILDQSATVGIVAVGMTLVITMGGIDLSVGSLLALAGGLGILSMNYVYPKPVGGAVEPMQPVLVAAVTTIAVGVVVGLFNGLLIAKGRLAPFIMTLAGLLMYRSVAGWTANSGQFTSEWSTRFAALGEGLDIPGTNTSRNLRRVVPAELPYAVVVWFIVACVGALLLNRTRLGRYIVAIGNNERAARYSAIAVDGVKIACYTLLGAITGIAALMNAANYTSVNSANTGLFVELDAIAAVVIGGTRLEGGSGSVFGTIIGVLLLGVIRNFMVMLNINSQAQGLVIGAIIVAAGLLQQVGRNRN